MKRPSFQFYPADFASNSNLKRCSWAAKGAWIMIMCLMHDSDEYGVLRWSLEDISLAVGCPLELVHELVKKGVLKGSDKEGEKVSFSESFSQRNAPPISVNIIDNQEGPIWYSSRMVRDEYVREKRASHGNKSQNHPNVPKKKEQSINDMDTDKVVDKDTFSPSPSSSSSSSLKTNTHTPPYPPNDSPGNNSQANELGEDPPPEKSPSPPEPTSTPAGRVCIAMRQAGIERVNPQHPKLLTLLKLGLTEEELIAAGVDAADRGKGFEYALTTAENRRREAEKIKPLPTASPKPEPRNSRIDPQNQKYRSGPL